MGSWDNALVKVLVLTSLTPQWCVFYDIIDELSVGETPSLVKGN